MNHARTVITGTADGRFVVTREVRVGNYSKSKDRRKQRRAGLPEVWKIVDRAIAEDLFGKVHVKIRAALFHNPNIQLIDPFDRDLESVLKTWGYIWAVRLARTRSDSWKAASLRVNKLRQIVQPKLPN